jgi:UDP-N-acetylmuramyl pentapeptide phosphotransferase/UDP-N-acetylglucosamine-1-phosphate transferase
LFALPGPSGPAVGAALGAAAALLPGDLKERVMLGDGGAGALGAAVGVGLAAGATPSALRRMTALVTALVLSSEVVSFNGVIEAVPALRRIDRLGRQR